MILTPLGGTFSVVAIAERGNETDKFLGVEGFRGTIRVIQDDDSAT